MRRLCVTLILSAILPVLVPAHADAFWRWLDELSGPGKFHGADVDIRIHCSSKPVPPDEYQSALMRALEKPSDNAETRNVARRAPEGAVRPKAQGAAAAEMKTQSVGAVSDCIFRNKKLELRRTRSFNVALGYQIAERTNLVYAEERERERSVFVASVRPMYWWRLMRAMDLGLGGGVYWFKASDVSVFRRHTAEIIFDVKPIALVRDWFSEAPYQGIPDSQYDQLLSVRAGVVTFIEGFEAKRFGAQSFKSGAAEVAPEVLWSLAVCLDLEPVFRMKRAARALETMVCKLECEKEYNKSHRQKP
jgi:hypothetical protein